MVRAGEMRTRDRAGNPQRERETGERREGQGNGWENATEEVFP